MDVETAAPVETLAPDGGAKRRQILDGARAVFMSDGFDGASMNDIARMAGVSKGTLYVYFDSKELLFEALIREDKQQHIAELAAIDAPGNARELLVDYGRALIQLLTRAETIAQLRMVIAATGKFPKLGQAFYEAGPRQGRVRFAARLREFCERGELEINDVELAAAQYLEMCKGDLFLRVLFGAVDTVPPAEIEHRVDSAVEVFLSAYGAKRPIGR